MTKIITVINLNKDKNSSAQVNVRETIPRSILEGRAVHADNSIRHNIALQNGTGKQFI